jgi:hypothetical protein
MESRGTHVLQYNDFFRSVLTLQPEALFHPGVLTRLKFHTPYAVAS